MRTCTKCKEEKADTEFSVSNKYWCRGCKRLYASSLRKNNLERAREYVRNWHRKNSDKYKAKRRKDREEVLSRYGGKCVCCGESTYEFLSFDHVNNDGAEHRKTHRGDYLLYWIKENNYPDSVRVLCYNCNLARGKHGVCPHGNLVEPEAFTRFKGESV